MQNAFKVTPKLKEMIRRLEQIVKSKGNLIQKSKDSIRQKKLNNKW